MTNLNWINIHDALPDNGEEVIIMCREEFFIGTFNKESQQFSLKGPEKPVALETVSCWAHFVRP